MVNTRSPQKLTATVLFLFFFAALGLFAIGACLHVIFLIDPTETITSQTSRLWAAEFASGSLGKDVLVALVWTAVCAMGLGAAVGASRHVDDRGRPWGQLWKRFNLASAVIGGILVSSVAPAFLIGTSLFVEAELQGFLDPQRDGQSTLISLQGTGLLAVLLSLTSSILERLMRARS